MKHRLAPLIGSLAVSVALASCAALPDDVGATVSVDRDIGEVTAISLRTSGTVTLTTGPQPALTITAGEKVIDNLSSEERGGVLILDEEGYTLRSSGQITYRLVLPAVEEISVDGSGDITGRGVAVKGLTVAIAGSGQVDLTGVADSQVVTIEGSGTYRGADLRTADSTVEISGSGDVDVHATSTLEAVIAGSGSITYVGGATLTRDITGSGSVEER